MAESPRQHARHLIRHLYERRPELCDLQIQCDDDKSGKTPVIFAHRAVLAAQCRCGPHARRLRPP